MTWFKTLYDCCALALGTIEQRIRQFALLTSHHHRIRHFRYDMTKENAFRMTIFALVEAFWVGKFDCSPASALTRFLHSLSNYFINLTSPHIRFMVKNEWKLEFSGRVTNLFENETN